MFREQMIKTRLGKATDFRWRGHEISRIEGLSDAVFGIACKTRPRWSSAACCSLWSCSMYIR